jgi:chloride channel protein, CIC family
MNFDKFANSSHLRKYTSLVREDLTETYSRDLHKWLIVAPVMGIVIGLLITLIAEIILKWIWPPLLHFCIAHPLWIIPIVTSGFIVAGLIMQYCTPNPDEHSTEEIIRAYHERQGRVEMRPFFPKLLAAIATVGLGGSAALEGPSIYGGGAIGSWMWTKLRRFNLEVRDRRVMLISGAAAGMAAVFRAPLTGLVFALEMPYKDDLAHEALLPSLIASVMAYVTMAFFLGAQPLFDFQAGTSFSGKDLLWCAVLGIAIGLIAMTFDITFRRLRTFMVRCKIPHWLKMAAGGAATGVCGWLFLQIFRGNLVPIGPNYEAVPEILQHAHGSVELVAFGVFKLAATLFSLGVGGVSAMFVPLFLSGSSFGVAFAQSIAHTPSVDLYAAVGMAAFIAAGYKTPLTAVVFVAEATGGHSYIIPSLIGAAVAYAVSGEASVSGDQKLHESLHIEELARITVGEAMERNPVCVEECSTVADFLTSDKLNHVHTLYPVVHGSQVSGTLALNTAKQISEDQRADTKVATIADPHFHEILADSQLSEGLRLLMQPSPPHMLVVTSEKGDIEGILTKTDVLSAIVKHVRDT